MSQEIPDELGVPFRAVVADSFYGEDRGFKRSVGEPGVAYVLSLEKSHSWWPAPGTIGALWEAALATEWQGPGEPGGWEKISCRFRDGHREDWWALEVEACPCVTDPARLPDPGTWHLTTYQPARRQRGTRSAPVSWPETLRMVRGWLEPWEMLWRYWRAFSGRGLYLYAR